MATIECPVCKAMIAIKVMQKITKLAPSAINLPMNPSQNGNGEKSTWHTFADGILTDYFYLRPGDPDPKVKEAVSAAYRRMGKALKDILAYAGGDPIKARAGTDAVVERMYGIDRSCNLDTVAKHFLDWNANPEAYENETKNKTRRINN